MQSWSRMDFGTGKIIFLDITQKEDMLQVEYPNGFLLDMGWYQDRYIISIIQNFDWTHPVQQYETAERNQLPTLLTEAVRLVEKESQSAGANGKRSYYERELVPPRISSDGCRREAGADGKPGRPLSNELSGPAYL